MGTLSQLVKGNSKKVCPLCSSDDSHFFYEDKLREYYQCKTCDLVFVPPEYWLTTEAEKQRYDQHENNIHDEGYRCFLGRIVDPLLELLPADKANKELEGLDFGCGPGPALYLMLLEMGFNMSKYDLFYCPEKTALNKQYDFITTTEVVEHLQNPKDVLEQLWNMLKPNGVLAIMTKRVIDLDAFKNWHYKNDDTHIVFFSEKTFNTLGENWRSKPNFVGNDVVLFKKN